MAPSSDRLWACKHSNEIHKTPTRFLNEIMDGDLIEEPISPMPMVVIVDEETAPLTPLDDWFLEFGRVEVLRNQARLALGAWHPPYL